MQYHPRMLSKVIFARPPAMPAMRQPKPHRVEPPLCPAQETPEQTAAIMEAWDWQMKKREQAYLLELAQTMSGNSDYRFCIGDTSGTAPSSRETTSSEQPYPWARR